MVFFKLSGKFAHFKFPYTSPNFLKKSFSIPPRTTILGLLGSILGLNGFQQYDKENEPDFYSKLKHIPMIICIKKIPIKTLVTYNSINSFAKNISKDAIVNIREEILLKPDYTIGLILDELKQTDLNLLKIFSASTGFSSNYHLYLGKNEFFANISDIELYNKKDFQVESCNHTDQLNSIIPLKLLNTTPHYENIIYDSFSKNVLYNEKKLKTELCEVGYFIEKEEQTEIKFTKPTKLLNVADKYYYVFEHEQKSAN